MDNIKLNPHPSNDVGIDLEVEPVKDFRRRLDIYMKEFHREHNLINNRMTWYVTSQSFLMIALAAAGNERNNVQILVIVIPIIGLFITIFTCMSILAAVSVQKTLKKKKYELTENFFGTYRMLNYEKERKRILEPWEIRGQVVQRVGMISPIAITIVMGISWIVILVLILHSTIACEITKKFL